MYNIPLLFPVVRISIPLLFGYHESSRWIGRYTKTNEVNAYYIYAGIGTMERIVQNVVSESIILLYTAKEYLR